MQLRAIQFGPDQFEGDAEQPVQVLLGGGDGGRRGDELRLAVADHVEQVPQPAEEDRGVGSEYPGVLMDLVDHHEPQVAQQ